MRDAHGRQEALDLRGHHEALRARLVGLLKHSMDQGQGPQLGLHARRNLLQDSGQRVRRAVLPGHIRALGLDRRLLGPHLRAIRAARVGREVLRLCVAAVCCGPQDQAQDRAEGADVRASRRS